MSDKRQYMLVDRAREYLNELCEAHFMLGNVGSIEELLYSGKAELVNNVGKFLGQKGGSLSPIEEIFGLGLCFVWNDFGMLEYDENLGRGIDGIYFTCQHPVGKYFLDFAIRITNKGTIKTIGIECDGHEFHQKTKDQVARDKKRDRFIQQHDIEVYRFSGSEIYKNPASCVFEIESVLYRHTSKLIEKDKRGSL